MFCVSNEVFSNHVLKKTQFLTSSSIQYNFNYLIFNTFSISPPAGGARGGCQRGQPAACPEAGEEQAKCTVGVLMERLRCILFKRELY